MFSYVCSTVYTLTQVLVQLYICQACSSDYPQTDSVESCHLILWGRVSGNTCWSSTCQVAKAILRFPLLLVPTFKFWDYRSVPLWPVLFICLFTFIHFSSCGSRNVCIYMCTYTYKYVHRHAHAYAHTWLPKVFYILSNHSTTKQQN